MLLPYIPQSESLCNAGVGYIAPVFSLGTDGINQWGRARDSSGARNILPVCLALRGHMCTGIVYREGAREKGISCPHVIRLHDARPSQPFSERISWTTGRR